ncbi:MAG: hypothetical protein IAF02_06535 [Anaerolineae bacterium]|nr:hypothetical protein [Anaerolineae bacterium]
MQTIIRSAIVNSQIRIQRKRLLPTAGTIVTGVGQKVTSNQTVARTNQNTRFEILPLSELLQLSPAEVEASLTVPLGSRISQGMIILEKKARVARNLTYESPYDGELFGINNGRVIIKQAGDVFELRAQLPGRVVKTISNQGIILETFGALIQAVWSTPADAHGPLKVLAHTPDGFIFPEQLTDDLAGQILAIGHVDQPGILEKAADSGIQAVIVGTMPASMYAHALTCGITVMVTNGAGIHGFSDAIFQVLKETDGLTASLFPAGAESSRPEIIIPQEKKATNESMSPTQPLAPGHQVRLLRRPYTNQMAEIVYIYKHAQLTTIGSRAHGASVRLESNQVVFVPFANMEAII